MYTPDVQTEHPSPQNPAENPAAGSFPSVPWQMLCGVLVLAGAAVMAMGAGKVEGDAGYGGVGPDFLPWVCAMALAVCGALLVWEASTGGFRHAGDPGGHKTARLMPFVWVSAGLLSNALFIEKIGFVLACVICYFLAVQGLRRAQEETLNFKKILSDLAWGFIISAPTYWAFSRLLGINLPHLLETGWL